jgi:hypothetical protein
LQRPIDAARLGIRVGLPSDVRQEVVQSTPSRFNTRASIGESGQSWTS